MSARFPPLTCQQVKSVLKDLGFTHRPKKSGTSHEDWVRTDESGRFFKVTVDCPKQPFSHDLIKSMAHQAGLSKKAFYALAGYTRKKKRLDPARAEEAE